MRKESYHMRKEIQMASNSPMKFRQPAGQEQGQIYTLEVFLIGGPISEKFVKKNPVLSRTIKIRGDQSLKELHHAIFDAFDRWEEHMYEFQFGKGPMDPQGTRYVLPQAFERGRHDDNSPAGRVDQTRIDSLDLAVGGSFGYWFDFGDDWWHQINVAAIEDKVLNGKFPKLTKRVGKSPPQYAEEDE
jgi:Plasmid pRiA4b ORF-3-like protein